jgi:phytoene synthase
MKKIYDKYCMEASKNVTKSYSTSFYTGVRFLDKSIRDDIHAIYGFVRFADEIVDTFHEFDKATLLAEFKEATYTAIDRKISLNPILNSFQATVLKYEIDLQLVESFFKSMEMDLQDHEYDKDLYEEYIYGSAEVVGLMCLKIFVYGSDSEYQKLKPYAMKLGSAFQKINFLRDLKADLSDLGRLYFPHIGEEGITLEDKLTIEKEIEQEFNEALVGIKMLPKSSRFGVYVSYVYYSKLLKKIKEKDIKDLMSARIRISNDKKIMLFCTSYVRNTINVI